MSIDSSPWICKKTGSMADCHCLFYGILGCNHPQYGRAMMAKALSVAPLSMKSVLSSYTLSLAVFIPISSWSRIVLEHVGFLPLPLEFSPWVHCSAASRTAFTCWFFVVSFKVAVARWWCQSAGSPWWETFRKSELVKTMSFVAIPALIGPMVGPLAGGLIVGLSHWRMIFFVNLPIGILGLYLVYKHFPDYRDVIPRNLIGLGYCSLVEVWPYCLMSWKFLVRPPFRAIASSLCWHCRWLYFYFIFGTQRAWRTRSCVWGYWKFGHCGRRWGQLLHALGCGWNALSFAFALSSGIGIFPHRVGIAHHASAFHGDHFSLFYSAVIVFFWISNTLVGKYDFHGIDHHVVCHCWSWNWDLGHRPTSL